MQPQVGWSPATYEVEELDDDGYIDGISVVDGGTGYTGEAVTYSNVMFGTNTSDPINNFDPQNWVEIPFRVRCGAGEIESEFGSGGGADTGDIRFDGTQIYVQTDDSMQLHVDTEDNDNNNIELNNQTIDIYAWNEDTNNWAEVYLNNGGSSAEVRITVAEDNVQQNWTFDKDGGITFPDGSTQTTAYTGQTSGSGELYIMANLDGNIVTSTDGVNWSDPIASGMTNINRVEVHNGVIVYIPGAEGPPGMPGTSGLYYSTTIGTTTLCAGTDTVNDNDIFWHNVHYFTNTNKWVAVGWIAGGSNNFPILAHSDNGISWTLVLADNTFVTSFNPDGRDWQLTDIAYINETSLYVITSYINYADTYGGIFVTQDITVPLDNNVHVPIQNNFWQAAAWSVSGYGGPPGYMILIPWTDEPSSPPVWFGYGTNVEDYSESSGNWWVNDVINQIGYLPFISEVAYDNNDFIAVTADGQVITPVFNQGGPSFVASVPLPYTTTDFSISATNPAVLTYSGPDELVDNEKIVVTDSGEYNGTYYWKASDGAVYTDQELTTALDATGFAAFTSGGTLTLSHGQYFDAAGTSSSYYYIGNDDEQVFRSSNGINWTLQTDVDGMYFNDFAYGSFGSITVVDTGDITFDGTDIQGDGTYSDSGTINLVPNPTLRNSGQYVTIYPTNNFDYPHVHMTAGEGGELYLGNDYQYVKTSNDGSMKISANNNGATKEWTFGTDGNLTLPAGGDIKDSNGTSVLGGSGSSGFTIARVAGQDDILAEESGNTLELVAGEGVTLTTNASDGTITVSAVSNATPQYGYFTELTHQGDNNEVYGEAVAIDSDSNSYVSYSYYDENDSADRSGIAKFSSTGEKLWSVNIASQNPAARNPNIVSLEFVTFAGDPALIALGSYYDNNLSKDIAFMYYVNPADGTVGEELIDLEIVAQSGMNIKDGVAGTDGGDNPYAVVVGETYDQTITKTFTPLAGSTTDKLFVSWADFAASGVNNGESVYYNENSNGYGVTMNAISVSANTPGYPGNVWDGISISVSVNEAGNYIVSRVNGWGYLVNSWDVPVSLIVLGADLGGVTGVNDMTFDFDRTVFNNDSNNIQAAISNIQGTPVTGVYCSGWGGYDWSTQIGNALSFNYQLNSQAYIARFGQSGGWSKNFGGGSYDKMHSVVVDSSENVYAAGYAWNGSKGSLVVKYDAEGTQQWAVYIDPSDNTGNELMSIDLMSDGNLVTVDEDGTVTKLNSSDGSIMWQVRADTGPSWDGSFRGTATPDGDYIITNYEDDNYTQYVMRISGVDGSSVWNKRITRTDGDNNGQMDADDDSQYIDCNATYVTIAGGSEKVNGDSVGIVYSFPINGENTDGTYDEFVVTSESMNWTNQSTTSTAATLSETMVSVSTASASPTSSAGAVNTDITTIGGAPIVEPTVIEWTNPDSQNTWRIETYNGGNYVYYNGGNGEVWWDVSNSTSGNSDFRGAIIEYHAYFTGRGTIIGTIHISSDGYNGGSVTHTEHMSGSSSVPTCILWQSGDNNYQLLFKTSDGNGAGLSVQWTAKVFYGQDYWD
jgi:hypothetical protein